MTLNALNNLQAAQLVDPAQLDAYGLKKPAYRAKIATDDGSSFQLLVNQPDAKGPVYAKLNNKAQVFEIAESSLKAIFTNLENQLEQSEQQAVEQNKQQSS